MVPKDFGGPNGFLRDAQGFLEVPTVLLLRYRYCSKSPVFLSSEYTSTFRFVFRPTASCDRMRSCVSLWATAASRPHTEKCPGFIGGACVLCLVLWPIDREPRAPSRKVPQAAEYHKPSRRRTAAASRPAWAAWPAVRRRPTPPPPRPNPPPPPPQSSQAATMILASTEQRPS